MKFIAYDQLLVKSKMAFPYLRHVCVFVSLCACVCVYMNMKKSVKSNPSDLLAKITWAGRGIGVGQGGQTILTILCPSLAPQKCCFCKRHTHTHTPLCQSIWLNLIYTLFIIYKRCMNTLSVKILSNYKSETSGDFIFLTIHI